ncbi:hypothetical protein [Pseudomonas bohemica]|uniref:hypothetical protein n=1 Tax=Pseudomonas bohemica TaxID=2044872 RepID=UPI000DA60F5D|nr:hypothetical protein [Pseudomonas bohemica]
MKAGNRIRVSTYFMGYPTGYEDFTVEEFRYCLGIFQTPQHRQAGHFTPLCELYERGPDSENDYIPNYGEYFTNPVQGWSDLPS